MNITAEEKLAVYSAQRPPFRFRTVAFRIETVGIIDFNSYQ